jgi:hypothetical protein
MWRSMLGLAALAGTTLLQVLPIAAADLPIQERETQAPIVGPAQCGPCGCLSVSYVYHPGLESTYGIGFDPRNYDTTEPHYYWGARRAYPQYYVDGVPIQPGRC